MTEQWAWGIDISTERIDVASVPLTGRKRPKHFTLNFPRVEWRGAERLHGIQAIAEANLRIWHDTFPAVVIGVELPRFRGMPHPSLAAVSAVVSVAAFAATRSVIFQPDSQEWKSALGLRGQADKEEVIAWASSHLGVVTEDDNIADSMAIAVCMRNRVGS